MNHHDPRTTRMRRTSEVLTKANGLTICWDSFGKSSDAPLFLIAGMGAQMISWDDEFCELLAARGFYVIRFDNRDVGRSTRLKQLGVPNLNWAMTRAMWRLPVRAPYLLDDMASDLVGLMDALNVEKAHLVGMSMGGTIAQTAAIEYPERVLSMTSIGSTTGAPDLPRPESAVVYRVMRPHPRGRDAYVEHYVETWKQLRADRFPEEEARDRERAIRIHARGLNQAGSARQLMAILGSGSRRSSLRHVTAPTQVIHGDVDPLVPLAAGYDTANSIPGAELLIIEGMGHALPLPVWSHILDAISGVAAKAG